MISDKKLDMFLGKRIKEKRESSEGKLTQAELAKLIGLSRASVTNIEGGNQSISLYHLYLVADVLQTSLLDLLPKIADIEDSGESKVEFKFGEIEHLMSTKDVEVLMHFLEEANHDN